MFISQAMRMVGGTSRKRTPAFTTDMAKGSSVPAVRDFIFH